MSAAYKPTVASLRAHAVPKWFTRARLGIMVHWGLYSIPAFAPRRADASAAAVPGTPDGFRYNPYAEWYQNSLRFQDGPTAEFHRSHYGENFRYEQFAVRFNEMLAQWQPDDWARRFAATGAGYVVLVSKHHDGFTLWPSEVAHPRIDNWSVQRDVVGELAEAVRGQGMKFGLYYSGGIDWSFKHRRIERFLDLVRTMPGPGSGYLKYANAHYEELIRRYRPDYLWNDICYPSERAALRIAANYYNTVDQGLINDRWISPRGLLRPSAWHRPNGIEGLLPPSPPVWDVRTPEYARFETRPAFAWECTRGMGQSFGCNQQETAEDLLSGQELNALISEVNQRGGNLLLNVGPSGSGEIDAMQLERLNAIDLE